MSDTMTLQEKILQELGGENIAPAPLPPNADVSAAFEKANLETQKTMELLYDKVKRTDAEIEGIKKDSGERFAKSMDEIRNKMEAQLAAEQTKLQEFKNEFLKAHAGESTETKDFQKSFQTYIADGGESFTDEEKKKFFAKSDDVVNTTSNKSGGFAIKPAEMMAMIDQKPSISDLSNWCNREYVSAKSATVPIMLDDNGESMFANELEEVDEKSTIRFVGVDFMLKALHSTFEMSQDYIEVATNPENAVIKGNIRNDRKALNRAILTGNGRSGPLGLLNSLAEDGRSGFRVHQTAEKGKLQLSDLKLPWAGEGIGPYRPESKWYMGTYALSECRFETGTNGQFKWSTDISQGVPLTLNGQPVVEVFEMNNLESGDIGLFYGDLESAYTIAENPNSYFVRDNYTKAAKRLVVFTFFRFLDGKPTDTKALQFLKIR